MTRCRACDWQPPMCPDCQDAAARDIAALALDHRDLCGRAPAEGAPEQRVSGSRTPAVPIDLAADELARGIVWALGVWEPPVREAAGLAPAPEAGIRPERLVVRAAAVLSAHVGVFCALPDTWGYPDGLEGGCVARSGIYGIASLRHMHRRALWALGLTEPVTLLPGLCSRCGVAALTRRAGADAVDCGHCGQRVADQQYRASVSMNVKITHHSTG